MKINVGIIGITGYTGGELLRLLLNHPQAEVKKATSRSNSGNDVALAHPNLKGEITLIEEKFEIASFLQGLDLVFLALPHGKSAPLAKEIYERDIRIIDLGADFRIKDSEAYEHWYELEHSCPALLAESVYGLPEIHKNEISRAKILANPGCYPTSIILGLAPLLVNKVISNENIIIDSKSGVSGAGKTLTEITHYSNINENLLAYKVGNHRHIAEIEQELGFLGKTEVVINFTPHLIPMNRGILSSIYVTPVVDVTQKDLDELYQEFYKTCPFIRLRDKSSLPQTKWVQGSNYCDIAPIFDERTGKIMVFSAIDNLVKGASGQAIQNMNIMFGLEETSGLKLAGMYP
ncbi:MAG: N-acetyl-gamma-glutamyl-phosphate reductase [Thermoanaerobacteraceae bacterium]|nr:N-acetyl-gamma-glutamyl-phosphate reductase [Thermoanaerobacteraceae bacterium]